MALTQKEISQLYVALLNRAADAGGVEFWQDQASLAEAAQAMIDSQAGTSFYPEDNRAFIDQIYENTVGLEGQEDADIQYWVDLLASGEYSRGELVAHMVNSIMDPAHEGTAFQESYLNRVAVSEYVAGLELDGELSVEELVAATTFNEAGLGVVRTEADATSATEKAGELEAVDNTSLTEGLEALAAAQTERAEFLKATYAANEDVEAATTVAGTEPTADEIATGVKAVFNNSLTNSNNDGVNDLMDATAVGKVDDKRSDAYNQALIDEQKSINDKAVSKAQDKVDKTTGLDAAVNALAAAQAGYTTALEAEGEAKATLDGSLAAVNTANGAAGYTLVATIPTEQSAANTATPIVTDSATQVIGFNAAGNLEIASAYKDDKRINELFEAVKAEVSALLSVDRAESSLKSAVAGVIALETTTELDGSETSTFTDTSTAAATGAGVFTDVDGNVYVEVNKGSTGGTLEATDTLHIVSDITVTPQANGTLAVDYKFDGSAVDVTVNAGNLADFTAVSATNTVPYTASDIDATNYLDLSSKANGYLDVEGTTTTLDFSADAADAWALISAEKAQADFNAAVEAYVEAKALVEELEGFDAAVTEAREALENDVEDGGLGINLLEGSSNFTVNDDVYLFSEVEGPQTLANFGKNGEDKIFFGTDFAELVTLGSTEAITSRVGDAAVLEIFAKQNGSNVDLYVEQETFAGNGSSDADTVKITLSGVSVEDLVLADGFLTLA